MNKNYFNKYEENSDNKIFEEVNEDEDNNRVKNIGNEKNILKKYHRLLDENKMDSEKGRRLLKIDILSILFAIGSWIGSTGIIVQLPLLVKTAPEGWALPSYITIVIQSANIGPIIYTIFKTFSNRKINDSYLIYFMYFIELLTSIFLILNYQWTMQFGSTEGYHSIALYIAAFCFAFIGCNSSVLFMPYMKRFPSVYLMTYLLGEGLCGLIPSCLALIQGAGSDDNNSQYITKCNNSTNTNNITGLGFSGNITNKNNLPQINNFESFSTQTFFIIIFGIQIISFIAFILLDNLKICKNEIINTYRIETPTTTINEYQKMLNDKKCNCKSYSLDEIMDIKCMKASRYRSFLLLMCLIAMLKYSVLPSIQSYSSLPYGNFTYHLTVKLSLIMGPIVCFTATFFKNTSIRNIIILSILATPICFYILTVAVLSPMPPLAGTTKGAIIIVFCWALLYALMGYLRISIIAIFRQLGGKSLIWIGAMQQIGSAIGAMIIYYLINYVDKLFVSLIDSC